jgi:uncharacterized membrane protein YeaQ/YmgE (transglycosylase-associated protein family)
VESQTFLSKQLRQLDLSQFTNVTYRSVGHWPACPDQARPIARCERHARALEDRRELPRGVDRDADRNPVEHRLHEREVWTGTAASQRTRRPSAGSSWIDRLINLENVMAVMFFAAFLGFGLVAGLAARRLMPGLNPAGVVGTILIGIAGGLIGGLVGSLFAGVPVTAFDGRSLLLAISGTLAALFGYRAFVLRWPDEPQRERSPRPGNVRAVLADIFASIGKRA